MKSGATHDKFGVLYTVWLPIEFHGFTSRINSKGYHSLVPGLISIFCANFYLDCKTRLCFIVPGRQEKIYLCTRKFLSAMYTQ